MIRIATVLALLVVIPAAHVQAANVNLEFRGIIKSIIDAGDQNAPPINIPEIPIGSAFTGTINYDSASPRTDGGNGYNRYLDLLSSQGTLTVNGYTFTTAQSVSAVVISKEAGFGFSGINIGTQPINLPDGWSIDNPELPYFTLQFRDNPAKTRSLALPTRADFPTDVMNLILDFQIPVTINGQTYGQRVFITGQITSLVPPPQQVTVNIDPNKVNLTARNKSLKVTVFGSPSFNVQTVVAQSIGLGDPALVGSDELAPPSEVVYVDANQDGRTDLVLSFSVTVLQDFGAIDGDSTELLFMATLSNDGLVFGSDAVSITGTKKNK